MNWMFELKVSLLPFDSLSPPFPYSSHPPCPARLHAAGLQHWMMPKRLRTPYITYTKFFFFLFLLSSFIAEDPHLFSLPSSSYIRRRYIPPPPPPISTQLPFIFSSSSCLSFGSFSPISLICLELLSSGVGGFLCGACFSIFQTTRTVDATDSLDGPTAVCSPVNKTHTHTVTIIAAREEEKKKLISTNPKKKT